MKEAVTFTGNRIVLYGMGVVASILLLLVGFVYDPPPEMNLKDYEGSLVLNMQITDFEAAREDIRNIRRLEPDHLYAILMDAYIYNVSGEYEKALALYREALPQAHFHPEIEGDIWDTIGILALKSGRYEEAQAEAEQKIALFGENVLSRLIIALSSFSMNDDKQYEEHLTKALETGIVDPALKIRLDSLVEDYETLQKLYIRSLLDRAKYEQQQTDAIWM